MIIKALRGPARHKYLALNDLRQKQKKLYFFLVLIRFIAYCVYMTLKDKGTGKELTFERLPNGILRAYDYHCAWDVTFKKVGDTWQGHMNGGYVGYKGILKQLNLWQQNLDAVKALAKDLAEVA